MFAGVGSAVPAETARFLADAQPESWRGLGGPPRVLPQGAHVAYRAARPWKPGT